MHIPWRDGMCWQPRPLGLAMLAVAHSCQPTPHAPHPPIPACARPQVLMIQGFLACRKHHDRLMLLVKMLAKSGLPCFKAGDRAIKALEKRFHLQLTEVRGK